MIVIINTQTKQAYYTKFIRRVAELIGVKEYQVLTFKELSDGYFRRNHFEVYFDAEFINRKK